MDSVKEILMSEEFIKLQNDYKKKHGYSCDDNLPQELLAQLSKDIAEKLVNRIFVKHDNK